MGTFTLLSSTIDLVKLINLLSFASKVGNFLSLYQEFSEFSFKKRKQPIVLFLTRFCVVEPSFT